jgi:two-component system phosphate regulon sensor histidine kinase PhoR
VALHFTRAEGRGLKLEQRLSPHPRAVPVDRAQMVQVLTNLIGNAVAYTPRGEKVWIATGEVELDERPGVLVQIHNDGVVIAADDMPHLFERFYRGKTGIDSGEAGTGLGLSICKEIVEQHSGRISVVSNEAHGTEVSVWLPLEA